MTIRTNFLDLLGADTRKYQSCIITSYSFDILYFEQIVLPRLRKAGILNVNIFVDATMFHAQLSQFTGKEYLKPTRDYSITLVQMKGAFHPKMMLAVGKTKGFLAIGSGNITASGFSNNEEIWSAFHHSASNPETEQIFNSAINYLSGFQKLAFGANSTKLNWIPQHSKWFRDLLERPSKEGIFNTKDKSFELFTSNADTSFLEELSASLPKKPITIKILSPYYNHSGDFLKNLLKIFEPENIQCVIDPEFGTYPKGMPPNAQIEFYNWKHLSREEKNRRRLHAKAIQFDYRDHTIFIAGSANATTEAFGTDRLSSKNAEAIIKIASQKKIDFFSELGINFSKTAKLELSNLPSKPLEVVSPQPEVDIYIYHAEYQNHRISLSLRSKLPQTVLRIENADAETIFEKVLPEQQAQFSISVEGIKPEELFKLSFWRGNTKISNYCLISNAKALLNTNPDERLARFNEIRNQDIFDDLGIETFLDFLNTENIFEQSRAAIPIKESQAEEDTIPESITTEEFNKNASREDYNATRQAHLTSVVEDFLSQLVFGGHEKEEISDNMEEVALQHSMEGTETGIVSHEIRELSFSDGIRIRRKLEKVLIRITKYISQSTTHFYTRKEKNLPEEQKISTSHINALLIGCSLILKYLPDAFTQSSFEVKIKYTDGKKLRELEETCSLIRHEKQRGNRKGFVSYDIDSSLVDKLKSQIEKETHLSLIDLNREYVKEIKHRYFDPIWLKDKSTDFLIFNLSTLLYAQLKNLIFYKSEDEEQHENQMKKLQDLALLLLSSYWCSRKGQEVWDLLILNLFYTTNFTITEEEMAIYLQKNIDRQQNQTGHEKENMARILFLYKGYLNFKKGSIQEPKAYSKALSPLLEGQVIFSTNYGFCVLEKVKKKGVLNLFSPLGREHRLSGLYGFESVYIGKAVKVFRVNKFEEQEI